MKNPIKKLYLNTRLSIMEKLLAINEARGFNTNIIKMRGEILRGFETRLARNIQREISKGNQNLEEELNKSLREALTNPRMVRVIDKLQITEGQLYLISHTILKEVQGSHP